MSISLHVEPAVTRTWPEFVSEHPGGYAIALDGYVSGRTIRDRKRRLANFDHHFDTDRFATRSTSGQVAMEINMGLFRTFQKKGIPTARIYVNDCDEDVCLAVWLLRNHERVEGHGETAINRFVLAEDLIDATGGAYTLCRAKSILRKMAWIYEPYHRARLSDKPLSSLSGPAMARIIDAVGERITLHVDGCGEELALDGSFRVIGGGSEWSMIREGGSTARIALFASGVDVYAVHVAQKSDRHHYTIGRRSVWVDFELEALYEHLNEIEGLLGSADRWGGSDIIGGSPRLNGSSLTPTQLEHEINRWLRCRHQLQRR